MRIASSGGCQNFACARNASLGPLAKLIGTFYLTSILFVLVILGLTAWLADFSVIKFLLYIKEEVLLVLAISSSEPAIPRSEDPCQRCTPSRTQVPIDFMLFCKLLIK
jgi:aerobic C4-dicarboxylate transport protein